MRLCGGCSTFQAGLDVERPAPDALFGTVGHGDSVVDGASREVRSLFRILSLDYICEWDVKLAGVEVVAPVRACSWEVSLKVVLILAGHYAFGFGLFDGEPYDDAAASEFPWWVMILPEGIIYRKYLAIQRGMGSACVAVASGDILEVGKILFECLLFGVAAGGVGLEDVGLEYGLSPARRGFGEVGRIHAARGGSPLLGELGGDLLAGGFPVAAFGDFGDGFLYTAKRFHVFDAGDGEGARLHLGEERIVDLAQNACAVADAGGGAAVRIVEDSFIAWHGLEYSRASRG